MRYTETGQRKWARGGGAECVAAAFSPSLKKPRRREGLRQVVAERRGEERAARPPLDPRPRRLRLPPPLLGRSLRLGIAHCVECLAYLGPDFRNFKIELNYMSTNYYKILANIRKLSKYEIRPKYQNIIRCCVFFEKIY